jgi:prepilin-type N-terminal cleavage/methylation domain-containing protein
LRGFTFVEMAVTIVVLGIAFILTLKGAVMVELMKAMLATYQARNFQTQVEVYLSENGALPGDDPTAPGRYGRPNSVTILLGDAISAEGNSKIDGELSDSLNANGEQYTAWRDLRYAGLIDGDPALQGASAMPENPFGGVYGFDAGNLGQSGGSLCLTKVPGRAARLIDLRLDDGVINTGKVVAISKFSIEQHNHFSAPDSQPYDDTKTYIVCMPMRP